MRYPSFLTFIKLLLTFPPLSEKATDEGLVPFTHWGGWSRPYPSLMECPALVRESRKKAVSKQVIRGLMISVFMSA